MTGREFHDTVDVRQEDFITQDEIDYAICIGSGFADGKFRIYEYFMDLHNQKENADFLKKEYGIGGQSGALPGNSSSNSEHDAKGILLEKGTDALILEDDEQPVIVNSDMAVTPITSVKTTPMPKKKVAGLCL